MKQFNKVVKDIDFNFNNIMIFSVLLNMVIVLLLSFLVLTLFRLNIFYAIIPAIIYFIIAAAQKLRERHYLDIEKAYPFLDEKLRTAIDNQKDTENPFVDDLQKEIIKDLRRVSISSFFASRIVSYKILSSILLSFLIVFFAVNNVYFDFSKLMETINNHEPIKYAFLKGNESGDEDGVEMDVRAAGGIASEDIYGDPMIAQLGKEELDLLIKPSSYEANLRDIEEPERIDFPELFPDEIFSSSAESYEENIPKEQQELVKNYFKKVTQ